MDQGPLVIEEIDAGAELVRAFAQKRPVKAAFWLKASDEDQRHLYIASDAIDVGNLLDAYLEVGRLAKKTPWLDPFRVKVIGGDDPLAIAATNVLARFPGRMATRIGGGRFDGITVDDVYIYPSAALATVP